MWTKCMPLWPRSAAPPPRRWELLTSLKAHLCQVTETEPGNVAWEKEQGRLFSQLRDWIWSEREMECFFYNVDWTGAEIMETHRTWGSCLMGARAETTETQDMGSCLTGACSLEWLESEREVQGQTLEVCFSVSWDSIKVICTLWRLPIRHQHDGNGCLWDKFSCFSLINWREILEPSRIVF